MKKTILGVAFGAAFFTVSLGLNTQNVEARAIEKKMQKQDCINLNATDPSQMYTGKTRCVSEGTTCSVAKIC